MFTKRSFTAFISYRENRSIVNALPAERINIMAITIEEKIQQLKAEKDAVILAHYYVPAEVQAIADHVGDSYALAKIATSAPQKVICFAGVSFMGESAKVLNPEKTVLMPDITADCPMAHMVTPQEIMDMRAKYDDLAVVCYINSMAEIKQYADVCVTSSNAVKIVSSLPQKNIFFIPDRNLGQFLAEKMPEKNFIFNDGHCPIHVRIKEEHILKAKSEHPGVKVLAHPECTPDVLQHADYIGSTSGIIDFATASADTEFIIATETGVFYELEKRNPGTKFYPVMDQQLCEGMKKVTLEKIAASLETMSPVMELTAEEIEKSHAPLQKMLELAK